VQVSSADGTFSLPNVPVYAGANELVVKVTDVSGNYDIQTRNVTNNAIALAETVLYDGKGNLTNRFSGAENWTYAWDWADRLVKVTSNGVVLLQNWYEGNSRRIAKREVAGGVTGRLPPEEHRLPPKSPPAIVQPIEPPKNKIPGRKMRCSGTPWVLVFECMANEIGFDVDWYDWRLPCQIPTVPDC
jgi:YD repeat-containing protein